MQAVPVTTAILHQLSAALPLAGALSYGADAPQLQPAAVTAFSSCIELVLGAGHACLRHLTAGGLSVRYSGVVAGQTLLMRQLLDAASKAGVARSQLVRDHLPPQALLAWLAAVVAVLQAIGASGAPVGEKGLPMLTRLCCLSIANRPATELS